MVPTSRSFRSQPVKPLTMFKYIGKKDASTIMTVFVVSPIPHHKIRSGIMLSGGTFLKNCTRYS